MFSTCIHCQQSLGQNQLLEHLPIGRRLAYDAAAGRVWVICPRCSRWNLVPFESRWEAIEESEKTFRATPLRASTDQVGLARTSEGTELVRIGAPQEPEFAAWRYGRHFSRRRWQYIGTTLPLGLVLGLATNPSVLMDIGDFGLRGWPRILGLIGAGVVGAELNARLLLWRTLAMLPLPDGTAAISRSSVTDVWASRGPDGGLAVWIPNGQPKIEDQRWFGRLADIPRGFTNVFRIGEFGANSRMRPTHHSMVAGDDAAAALRTLLPIMNEWGASRRALGTALECLRESGSDAAQVAFNGLRPWQTAAGAKLHEFRRERRLALEMAVHADSERRWLEGEMMALLEEWRRASEIAAIADGLLTDLVVEQRVRALREDAGRTAPPAG